MFLLLLQYNSIKVSGTCNYLISQFPHDKIFSYVCYKFIFYKNWLSSQYNYSKVFGIVNYLISQSSQDNTFNYV